MRGSLRILFLFISLEDPMFMIIVAPLNVIDRAFTFSVSFLASFSVFPFFLARGGVRYREILHCFC